MTDNIVDADKKADADLIALVEAGRRVVGDHYAPNDCYATGPLTGDAYLDLIQCPSCAFLSLYDAYQAKIKKGGAA